VTLYIIVIIGFQWYRYGNVDDDKRIGTYLPIADDRTDSGRVLSQLCFEAFLHVWLAVMYLVKEAAWSMLKAAANTVVVVLDALAYSRSRIIPCRLRITWPHDLGLFGGPGLTVGIGYRNGD